MKKNKGDVYWFIRGKKNPIAYSTQAVSNAIVLYSKMVDIPTPNNILKYFEDNELIGLYDEITILQKYVELGNGDVPMNLL
jgi:hypothetical protein